MDKTMIGILTGASALALVGGVESSAAASLGGAYAMEPARSFAELLEPIPHATDVLRAEHERDAADQKPFEVAQYQQHHHHHHHHHYRYSQGRPRYYWRWGRPRHHHHHHHQQYLQY